MNALPGISLSWNQSAEPIGTFQRYQVYRRVSGQTAWTKAARLQDRAATSYIDYTAVCGVLYEYAVTVVGVVGTEELESAFPAPVSGSVSFIQSFLHIAGEPGSFAALDVANDQLVVTQPVSFVQVRGRPAPTPHVGTQEYVVNTFNLVNSHFELDREVRDTVTVLISRQRTTKSTLYYRDARGLAMYCHLAMQWKDQPIVYAGVGTLTQVWYDDSVA